MATEYDTTICVTARETVRQTLQHLFGEADGTPITTTDWTGVSVVGHIRAQADPSGLLLLDLGVLPSTEVSPGVLQVDFNLSSAQTEILPPISYVDIWADRPDPLGTSLVLRAKILTARTVTRVAI